MLADTLQLVCEDPTIEQETGDAVPLTTIVKTAVVLSPAFIRGEGVVTVRLVIVVGYQKINMPWSRLDRGLKKAGSVLHGGPVMFIVTFKDV